MKWQCSDPVPSRITPLMQGSSDRSLPLQDDAERQRSGMQSRHTPKPCHKAATDAHSNITILVRVPHHTPTAPRHGCTVNRLAPQHTASEPRIHVKWCRSSLFSELGMEAFRSRPQARLTTARRRCRNSQIQRISLQI